MTAARGHTTRPELTGDFGMVASTHWLASGVGMGILERGGNAADAAAAAGFALQVVEPHLNGPGGDATLMVWDESAGTAAVVCGQGVAPQAATVDRFRDLGLDLVPGTGLLPAVVPGAFGAWTLLAQRWGTRSLREVLEPAIGLASAGHPLLDDAAHQITALADLFRTEWPTSAALWLPQDTPPSAGERFRNPVLAATYGRLVAEAERASRDRDGQFEAARETWSRGFVAEAVDRFVAGEPVADSTGSRHRGLLTADDMAAWQPTVEPAWAADYAGWTVFKAGPWTQGPVLLQQLALLERTELADVDPLSVDWVHTIVEAGKLAFADREAWYGDPHFTGLRADDLLDPGYAELRARAIGPCAALDVPPGAVGGRTPRPPRLPSAEAALTAPGVGEPTVASAADARGDTCHLDVIDRGGLMIAATPSGGWLQSSPTIPELGFCLGTRGQMFWLEEGVAAGLRPGARPRTTLTPSLAVRGDGWRLAFGTPGGDQQDQWSLHFFLNLVHGRAGLQRSIDAPQFHSRHVTSSFYPRGSEPGVIAVESRVGRETIDELMRRGHRVEVAEPWSLGRLSAVGRDRDWLRAAANPRGAQGYAVGR